MHPKTDRVTIARTRLPDEIEKERKKAENASALVKGKMTGGDAIRIYNERIQGRVDLKPLTKAYHSQRIDGLLRSWSVLEKADLSKLTKTDCLNWAARFGPEVSATTFNHTIGILRALFEIGIEAGIRFDNPAKAVNRVTERLKKLQLPEPDQFQKFIEEVENSGSGFSKPCRSGAFPGLWRLPNQRSPARPVGGLRFQTRFDYRSRRTRNRHEGHR